MADLLTLAHEDGFSQCAPVNMDALNPPEAVRDMCKADRCGRYGKSWSCPPACSNSSRQGRKSSAIHRGFWCRAPRSSRMNLITLV